MHRLRRGKICARYVWCPWFSELLSLLADFLTNRIIPAFSFEDCPSDGAEDHDRDNDENCNDLDWAAHCNELLIILENKVNEKRAIKR